MRSRCCLYVCVSVYPPIAARKRLRKSPLIVARQRLSKNSLIVARHRLGRNVTALTNTRNDRRIDGRVVFIVVPVISRKVGD
jgi:hypothetical protein